MREDQGVKTLKNHYSPSEHTRKHEVRKIDLKYIEELYNEVGQKLTLMTLPGPFMWDVRTWKDYIDMVVIFEQDPKYAQIIRFVWNLQFRNIPYILFEGNIFNTLEHALSYLNPKKPIVVNLDFEGGLYIEDQSKDAPLFSKCIEPLLKRFKHEILLLITLSIRGSYVRPTTKKDVEETIKALKSNLGSNNLKRIDQMSATEQLALY